MHGLHISSHRYTVCDEITVVMLCMQEKRNLGQTLLVQPSFFPQILELLYAVNYNKYAQLKICMSLIYFYNYKLRSYLLLAYS